MDPASEIWDESRLEQPSLLKYNVHTPFQSLPLTHVQRIAQAAALPVALMLFNLQGDMNIGMSIRTAVILGCSDVYIVGRRKYDRRSEVGAKHYIHIHRFPSITADFFQDNKLVPLFLEQGGTALEEFSFKPYLPGNLSKGWKVVFVVGSESFGIPSDLLRSLKAPVLSISQYGVLRSLNVSIAASIVLYEYAKQWRQSVCI